MPDLESYVLRFLGKKTLTECQFEISKVEQRLVHLCGRVVVGIPTEIAIVSIFGRGHWLAVELAKVGIPVALVDVTPDQGPWSEVDPIGTFWIIQSRNSARAKCKTAKPGCLSLAQWAL